MQRNTHGVFDLNMVVGSLIEAARTTPLVSREVLSSELQRIVAWYKNGGLFYDADGNEYRGHQKALVCEANPFSSEHMCGKRDTATKEPSSRHQQELLDSYIPSNAWKHQNFQRMLSTWLLPTLV